VKEERHLLLRRYYGGSMAERLDLARALYATHGAALRQHPDMRRQLALLAQASATLSAHMAAIGLNALCAACAASPGGGCCSAAIGDDCDTPLLLTNLLLGINIVCQDSDPASCRFLGPSGCPFAAKPIFCLNYNCEKILEKVRKEDLASLYRLVGEALGEQGRVEEMVLDFLKEQWMIKSKENGKVDTRKYDKKIMYWHD